jgi:hypothetical protein
MLRELRGFPLLTGARGGLNADLDAIADAVLAIARAGLRLGDRMEAVEVNPLLASENGVQALDALVITTKG